MLFNEPKLLKSRGAAPRGTARRGFSALQRAEIAEIALRRTRPVTRAGVSVLFNEPKLLKSTIVAKQLGVWGESFSALQRAEIAEISRAGWGLGAERRLFQCSSTSRNC